MNHLGVTKPLDHPVLLLLLIPILLIILILFTDTSKESRKNIQINK